MRSLEESSQEALERSSLWCACGVNGELTSPEVFHTRGRALPFCTVPFLMYLLQFPFMPPSAVVSCLTCGTPNTMCLPSFSKHFFLDCGWWLHAVCKLLTDAWHPRAIGFGERRTDSQVWDGYLDVFVWKNVAIKLII